jgi:hypothetical protein
MKRAIINQLSLLSEQLKGYVGALNYRYMNLCVKAEEASMLPIEIPIEDELKKMEDVAFVGKKTGDDYSLYIVPKIQDDMRDIAKTVMLYHPEFIQEIEQLLLNMEHSQIIHGFLGGLCPYLTVIHGDNMLEEILKVQSGCL